MDFNEKIEEIIKKDPRYKSGAYEFVTQALEFTQKKLNRNRHVTGRELLEGIKEFGLEQYGPMTKTLLKHWGIKKTDDFGEIVFNMVENGLMGKTENDSRKDFKNVYDLAKVFDSKKLFETSKPR